MTSRQGWYGQFDLKIKTEEGGTYYGDWFRSDQESMIAGGGAESIFVLVIIAFFLPIHPIARYCRHFAYFGVVRAF